ncbi:MAG: hypothetical protein J0H75_12880, partial [Rhizobiales bacterium]|nr:hypothetical protein [Hyphomicrobiales bacterium]
MTSEPNVPARETTAHFSNPATDRSKHSHTEPIAATQHEHTWRPPAEGLYDLSQEKDACGVSFIANIKGRKSHQIVEDA